MTYLKGIKILILFALGFLSSTISIAKDANTIAKGANPIANTIAKDTNSIVNTPQFIEIKAKTEELISKRYRDQLSTQLDISSFSVNVSVVLGERKKIIPPVAVAMTVGTNAATIAVATTGTNSIPTKLTEKISSYAEPEDLTTGVVTLLPLLSNYQQELLALQNQLSNQINTQIINQLNNQKPVAPVAEEKEQLIEKLEIRRVEVLLGLDSGISSAYRRDIEDWLNKAVVADFGKLGTYKINTIRKIVKPEEPPKVLTSIEKVNNLQILLGFGVLASVIFLGLFAHKWILSKDVKEQTQTALRIQEMKASLQAAERRDSKNLITLPNKKELAADKTKELATNAGAEINLQTHHELQQKIFSLHFKMQNLTKNLFEIWFDEGEDGRFKAASFIDAILSRRSLNNDTDFKALSESVILPEKWRKDVDFAQVFREFPKTTLLDKNEFLEQVYWDMLSVNLLGSKTLRAPFEILLDLPNEKVQRILHQQDPKIKSLALLHMSSESVQNYLGTLSEIERQKIIESALKLQSVPMAEVESANELINNKVKQDEQPFGYVQLTEQLPNLLFSLSAREELNLLPQIIAKLPDEGLSIKRAYPSIAFIPEWPDQELKTLFENSEVKTISTYLFLVPGMTDKILSFLPNRLVMMIKEELNNRKTPNEKEIEKNIGALKLQLLQKVQNGVINFGSIFVSVNIAESAAQLKRKAS
jgi:hypothetical protein